MIKLKLTKRIFPIPYVKKTYSKKPSSNKKQMFTFVADQEERFD